MWWQCSSVQPVCGRVFRAGLLRKCGIHELPASARIYQHGGQPTVPGLQGRHPSVRGVLLHRSRPPRVVRSRLRQKRTDGQHPRDTLFVRNIGLKRYFLKLILFHDCVLMPLSHTWWVFISKNKKINSSIQWRVQDSTLRGRDFCQRWVGEVKSIESAKPFSVDGFYYKIMYFKHVWVILLLLIGFEATEFV